MSKSKVFWTDEEKQQLIEALALEMTANHRELRLNLVNEVQKVLPPTRRRNIISLSVVPDLIKSVKDLVHKLQEPEVVERVVEVEKIVEVACVKMCSTTELLAELFNRIDQRITRLEQAIGKVGLEPRIVWEHPEIPQPPEAPKKPKVLVVGLKYTHQHKFIEDRLGHALGFR